MKKLTGPCSPCHIALAESLVSVAMPGCQRGRFVDPQKPSTPCLIVRTQEFPFFPHPSPNHFHLSMKRCNIQQSFLDWQSADTPQSLSTLWLFLFSQAVSLRYKRALRNRTFWLNKPWYVLTAERSTAGKNEGNLYVCGKMSRIYCSTEKASCRIACRRQSHLYYILNKGYIYAHACICIENVWQD